MFNNEVSIVDENTRSYIGESSWEAGTFAFYTVINAIDTEYDLTGVVIEGTSLCIPIEGTITSNTRLSSTRDSDPTRNMRTTITKTAADTYWRVTVVNVEDEAIISDFFARTLNTELFLQNDWAREFISPDGVVEASYQCNFGAW